MAKMALIDPSFYTTNYGVRCVSAYLWANGVEAKLIFLKPETDESGRNYYPESVLEDLAKLVEDCDVIGFTVFTNFYFRAAELSGFLKNKHPDKPIVWGGIHATVSPESSIKHADIVCLGEGEETALEIMRMVSEKKFRTDVLGTWVKTKEGIMKNDMRRLEENLDAYPYQDYEPSHMHVIKNGRIVKVDESLLKEMLHLGSQAKEYFDLDSDENYQYLTLSTRGCLYQCAYCCNNAYQSRYAGKGRWLRSRSIKHVIGELVEFRKKHGYVNFISFFDDDFLARPNEFILEFFDEYDQQVGLPFKCNFGAFNVNRIKIKRLYDSGLKNCEMGLQSGSERVHKEVYFRPFLAKQFMEAAKLLAEFPIITYYDVILDNPYETEEDLSKTIVFVAGMPKPMQLSCFSLTFFPGTALYNRAVSDGLVDAENLEPISSKKNNALYLNNAYSKMLVLAAGKTPPYLQPLYKIAAQPAFLKAFSKPLPDRIFAKILAKALNR